MTVLIHKRKPKPASDGSISFPALQCWNPVTKVATIVAMVSGNRVTCRVKVSDLRKKFHIFTDDPMNSIKDCRPKIEIAAKKLIETKKFEKDGSIMIRYKDL